MDKKEELISILVDKNPENETFKRID